MNRHEYLYSSESIALTVFCLKCKNILLEMYDIKNCINMVYDLSWLNRYKYIWIINKNEKKVGTGEIVTVATKEGLL